MTIPSLWQLAAGLGVGAFVAALFYGVVRHFGRRRGEGFETSRLGRQATAIVAVLIILIAGGATITALVMYAPRGEWDPPTGSAAREEQLQAITLYASASRSIYITLGDFRATYEEAMAGPDVAGQRDAHDRHVLAMYEQLNGEVDLWEMNHRVKAAFPNFRYQGRSWDEIREHGRELFKAFCDTIFDVYSRGESVVIAPEVEAALEAYLEFRKLVADAARESIIN